MAGSDPPAGRARIIGLTGSPGVGKSTSTSALVRAFRERDKRVGVLAVDPSSPFTGGALLGDRVRMQDHASDPGVFIRSMASRGHLGGLSWATPQAMRVLDAAGCEVVLVETVGVGQAEVEIASLADSTDRAARARDGRRHPGGQGGHPGDRGRVRGEQGRPRRRPGRPYATCATCSPWPSPGVEAADRADRGLQGEGVDDVVEPSTSTWPGWRSRASWRRRRQARARDEIEAIALTALRYRFAHLHGDQRLDVLADRVLDGDLDPYTAADELMEAIG